jgi:hypothetical protein
MEPDFLMSRSLKKTLLKESDSSNLKKEKEQRISEIMA